MKQKFWAALVSVAISGSALVTAHGGEDERFMSGGSG